ncbi:hypothetical protein [Endozoicomonas montiporae]|uniref:Uncharacterized protein n=1 Tax=Endozoicomonas montiporae CL-33 TaxID=570277 RepID=A0A142BA14_9GAMM|nr:hypothetical protein [Endozoicomonas montiporae]AMO55590.1 hypothetical protein EZMO1_1402 [Endozoicomonas montiporae CL-33]
MKKESNALEQLELWNILYPNKPLQIGCKVKVHPDCPYQTDWNDEYIITGLCVDYHRDCKLNITIADHLTDAGSDGWGAGDLVAA